MRYVEKVFFCQLNTRTSIFVWQHLQSFPSDCSSKAITVPQSIRYSSWPLKGCKLFLERTLWRVEKAMLVSKALRLTCYVILAAGSKCGRLFCSYKSASRRAGATAWNLCHVRACPQHVKIWQLVQSNSSILASCWQQILPSVLKFQDFNVFFGC